MGLPRHLPRESSGSGHGPFGDAAFKAALIGCVVLVIVVLLMMFLGGEATSSVGTAFLVLGVLGLVVGALGLLASASCSAARLRRHACAPETGEILSTPLLTHKAAPSRSALAAAP